MENKTGNRFYFASGALLLSLIVFLVTAAPGVTFTDAGELAGVCTSLGVAHPTGYPLFTIMGHLWTLLPIAESPVFELNLFAGMLVIDETIEVTIAIPAEGPSFGVAPSGTCI